jgi:hypothetical protein
MTSRIKKTVGGRGFKHLPTQQFQPHASNTICDVTGFKVKSTEVVERWEGYFVIPEAFHPRQPQDFPVVPVKQHVYEDARKVDADLVIPLTPNDYNPV